MGLSEFVQSPAYKKVMGKVYGWGAALVLAGALFKIQHYPGAGPMLLVGMGTEIVIFFLSAFEPPHEMPDWSLVYPELVGLEPNEDRGRHRGGSGGGGGSDLAALIESGTLEPEIVEKLSQGIKKLSATTGQLADLSDASLATESYLQSMKMASESVSKLSNSQAKGAQELESLSSSYGETAQKISAGGQQLADGMAAAGNNLVKDIESSGQALVSSYQSLSKSMNENAGQLATNSESYKEQLSEANKQLAAINSVYEMQLKSISEQMEASKSVTTQLGSIDQEFRKSVEEAKTYQEELGKLNQNISELNTIYGNMLSAMNMGSKQN
ncbi:gliding motility protein GldL [Marinilabilia salmonicolor]|uniref:Gliding motility-associated protein GldL n=1 Tax=Marinilabilia salmonicolor TaxID=989 RepID=A0A368VB80_9BACT|nr:gliding motility protein GldL [Marinilabilia salmonicolor]RCW37495.1 gliding motility-associated protein GldL [Marinilabilia salmonicolor]